MCGYAGIKAGIKKKILVSLKILKILEKNIGKTNFNSNFLKILTLRKFRNRKNFRRHIKANLKKYLLEKVRVGEGGGGRDFEEILKAEKYFNNYISKEWSRMRNIWKKY